MALNRELLGAGSRGGLVGNGAGHVGNDGGFWVGLAGEVRLGGMVTLVPGSRRGVGAETQKRDGKGDDHGQRNEKGQAPGLADAVAPGCESVVHRRHDNVGDAAPGCAKPAGERIGGANNVFVKETCRPDLAGDKCAPEDTDKEAAGIQTLGAVDKGGEAERDRTDEEKTTEILSRAEEVT